MHVIYVSFSHLKLVVINGIMVVEDLAEVVDVDAVVVVAEDIAPYHYSIVGHMEEITVMSAHSV